MINYIYRVKKYCECIILNYKHEGYFQSFKVYIEQFQNSLIQKNTFEIISKNKEWMGGRLWLYWAIE